MINFFKPEVGNAEKKSIETPEGQEASPKDRLEASNLLRRILECNPKARSLVLSSLLAFNLGGPMISEARENGDKNKDKREWVNSEQRFENNTILKDDIKRWIHWIKTREFIDSSEPDKVKEITDADEKAVKWIYMDLERNMDVWNLGELTMFSMKLEYAAEALEGRKLSDVQQELEKQEIPELTGSDYSALWNPSVNFKKTEEAQEKFKIISIQTAVRLRQLLSESESQ